MATTGSPAPICSQLSRIDISTYRNGPLILRTPGLNSPISSRNLILKCEGGLVLGVTDIGYAFVQQQAV
jgi:hypothetical protein